MNLQGSDSRVCIDQNLKPGRQRSRVVRPDENVFRQSIRMELSTVRSFAPVAVVPIDFLASISAGRQTNLESSGVMSSVATLDAHPQVFLVEDDLDIREAVIEILTYEGIAVRCFSNGREGIDQLLSGGPLPRLILLDLMMPVMDGHEFLREKARHPELNGVSVVVMTADAFVLQNPSRLGAVSDLVKKPIDIDRLIDVVRQHISDFPISAN